MKNSIPVSTIMTTNLITVSVTDTLSTAEHLLKKNKIRHIPVVFNEEIVGMLSLSDILRLSFADVSENETPIDSFLYDFLSIPQVMAKNVFSVPSNYTIKEVSSILVEKEFHALPVVDDKQLVGIVTTTDLIQFLEKSL
jgi:CBS domain-containing protein